MPRRSEGRVTSIFRVVPLFGVLLGVYLLLASMAVDLTAQVFGFTLMSDAHFTMTGNDVFMVAVIFVLFFELIKASNATHRLVFVEHILSTLVFIGFVVALITVEACGNATFFLMGLVSLIDVLAGWTITYRAGLRDWGAS